MTFFFGLENVIFANWLSEQHHGALNKSRDGDPLPVADGAAASNVVDHIQLSM